LGVPLGTRVCVMAGTGVHVTVALKLKNGYRGGAQAAHYQQGRAAYGEFAGLLCLRRTFFHHLKKPSIVCSMVVRVPPQYSREMGKGQLLPCPKSITLTGLV